MRAARREGRFCYWPVPLAAACACSIFFAISALTASRLKLAPFCIGGYSRKVWSSLPITCWTNTKRQNWNLNQSKYCCAPSFVPLFGQPWRSKRIETQVDQIWHVNVRLFTQPALGLVDEPILVVVDAHRTDSALAEVEDLVTRPMDLCR